MLVIVIDSMRASSRFIRSLRTRKLLESPFSCNLLTSSLFLSSIRVLHRLANKQDSPSAFDESDIVHTLNIEELANRFEVPCRVVSIIKFKLTSDFVKAQISVSLGDLHGSARSGQTNGRVYKDRL